MGVFLGLGLVVGVLIVSVLAFVFWNSRTLDYEKGLLKLKNLVASYQKQKSLSLGLTIRHRCGGSVELMGADASLETQVYHAASVGKMFTAVAIARLIEAKK